MSMAATGWATDGLTAEMASGRTMRTAVVERAPVPPSTTLIRRTESLILGRKTTARGDEPKPKVARAATDSRAS